MNGEWLEVGHQEGILVEIGSFNPYMNGEWLEVTWNKFMKFKIGFNPYMNGEWLEVVDLQD